jgi:heptosyltransferase-2
MKPKLVVVELWGIGDLVIATPFLRAASERYEVTLVAKPYAQELQARFWPGIKVVSFVAPWTAFRGKYYLINWPWRQILRLRQLRRERFDIGVSTHAGGDPRDHLLLRFLGARRRISFPRWGSRRLLTDSLPRPNPSYHRYEHWRSVGLALDLNLPPADEIQLPPPRGRQILLHSGAGQKIRVWPLERYAWVAARLRQAGYSVQVACDPDQQAWWRGAGEREVLAPRSVTELIRLVDQAAAFLGNDSGPAHLAAMCGVPTFVLFGPQLPEWFAPLHPLGDWIEGKACPYKPCKDSCLFPQPHCLVQIRQDEVLERFLAFLARVTSAAAKAGASPAGAFVAAEQPLHQA